MSTDFETPVAALFAHMIAAATIAFTADATADSAILENVSTLAGMFPGLPVFGAGAAEGATILEIDEEAATVTLSDALTQDGSVVDFEIGFQTTSRRVAHWGSVPEQPAFFLRRVGVTDHVDHENFYVMTTLECEAWVYSKAGQNPDIAPDTALTALERMLRESFAPDGDYGDPRFTLAGTVHWCRFEGKSDISPGDQGGQAIARLPIRITLP